MSIEDNTNETENQIQPEESSQSAASSTQAVEAAQNAASNILANVMALKESNPKVFFGGVGAVVILLLVMMMSGSDKPSLPVHQVKQMVPGQNYVLKSPNTYDPEATVRLVSVPGSMAAYDDSEEADREGACKHMVQNTPVKLVQTQNDSSDPNVVWVEVEMTGAGECQGKKGWTSSINLQ